VAKFSASGASLLFATYLGGSGYDAGTGIALNVGSVYVTGSTSSAGWATAGAYDTTQTARAMRSSPNSTQQLRRFNTRLILGNGDDFAWASRWTARAAHT